MRKETPEQNYQTAKEIAEAICDQMSWVYMNYQILIASETEEIKDKFSNTYAGNVWQVLRKATLNEILGTIARILIDKDDRVASLHKLRGLIDRKETKVIIEKNYTQGEGTFERRFVHLTKKLNELDGYLKDDKKVSALTKYRNNHLAHSAIKPYKGQDNLKWGDERYLIGLVAEIVGLMETVLLNKWNISHSTNGTFEVYANDFWTSFQPKK